MLWLKAVASPLNSNVSPNCLVDKAIHLLLAKECDLIRLKRLTAFAEMSTLIGTNLNDILTKFDRIVFYYDRLTCKPSTLTWVKGLSHSQIYDESCEGGIFDSIR